MSAIQAVDLGFDIDGVWLVRGVDLEIGEGEFVGIVGPNGAGKSTLISLLAGELESSTGSVMLKGERITGLNATDRAMRRAVLPQQTVLQFAFQCLEVVLMGRYPHNTGADEDRRVAESAMAATDTVQFSDRVYPTLSGGEQTRVSLARVLTQKAPIVFLDEPTGSLDIRHQELVMEILKGLAAEGASVVAVLHDLNLAARHTDRVALMDRGGVVALDSTSSVLRSDLLSEVYSYPISVVDHPELPCRLVLPGADGG